MDSLLVVKARILFKMARRRNWGGSHMAFDNLKRGFKPKDLPLIKKAGEELIREGLLVRKPTGYGLHVSLNPEKAGEIKSIIRELLGINVA
jgi:hypothetical protein